MQTRITFVVSVLFLGVQLLCASDGLSPLVDFTPSFFSRLDNQEKALLEEYARFYPHIKQFYRNIHMEVLEKQYLPKAKDSPISSETEPLVLKREKQYIIRCNDSREQAVSATYTRLPRYVRWDSQCLYYDWNEPEHVDVVKFINDNHAYKKNITIITPEVAYELTKRRKDANYYSLDLKQKLSANTAYEILYFDNAPYSCDGRALEFYFFDLSYLLSVKFEGFIDYIKPLEIAGKQLIELRICPTGKDNDKTQGRIIRFAKNSWVVQDVFYQGTLVAQDVSGGTTGIAKAYWDRMSCVYSGVHDGIPLLKSVEKTQGFFEDNDPTKEKRVTLRTIWEITKIIPGPVCLEEFDVKQFLPPEAGDIGVGIASATFPIWRIACIVLGIILLITGVGLQIWKTRQSKNRAE